jgi:glycerol-3-phosphate dehydrogenase
MRRTAPHLVHALPMVIPLTPDVSPGQGVLTDLAHHLASGMRRAAGTQSSLLPPPRRLGVPETRRLLPGLRSDRVRGGLLHWDGQVEDDARLVVALARTAASQGARILTYSRALAAGRDGALIRDELDGGSYELRARVVVNAAGVWAGSLSPVVALRPSKGVHLVLPAAALGRPTAAMTVPVPGQPNRYVFAIPQPDDLLYLGLTDDELDGEPPELATVNAGEEAFLLNTVNRALAIALTPADVIGRFAGVRPLLKAAAGQTADLSRRHAVLQDASGMWTVVGGKLTTYRRMAQDTVDHLTDRPCRTASLPLVGAHGAAAAPGLAARLVRRYGSEAGDVAALAPGLLTPVAPGLPVLGAEFAWAVAREGAMTVADLLERRTRLSLVDGWAEAARPAARAAVDGELLAEHA